MWQADGSKELKPGYGANPVLLLRVSTTVVRDMDGELGVGHVEGDCLGAKLAASAANGWEKSGQVVERDCAVLIWGKLGHKTVDVEAKLYRKGQEGHFVQQVTVDYYEEWCW